MNRRFVFQLLGLSALAAGVAFASAPATPAAERGKAEVEKVMEAIKRNGKLPGGATYWRHAEALHAGPKRTVAAAALNKQAGARSALTAGTRSTLTTVGGEGLPPGFGKGFTWDRADSEILLVMFINAADPLGISIEGVQAGDQVQVLSASGIASFSEDKGNPLASSIVGLVAAGAKGGIGMAGAAGRRPPPRPPPRRAHGPVP